jgi:hypothetical protein
MRTLSWLAFATLVACGNSPDPRVIAGGGIGDGDIDGLVNVYVIDNVTYQPIADATVEVGGSQATTDDTGLVIFQDVSGPQTIAVKAAGYRMTVWEGANGANVTVPLTVLGNPTAQQATISGSITAWDAVSVAAQHVKAALVLYSQTDDLGDAANNIATPNNGNLCLNQTTCDFSVVTRTGTVTLVAAIIDIDTKGTLAGDDDTQTIIGWATAPSIQVDAGVDQSGIALSLVQAGELQNATIDYGTPPAALANTAAVIGVEVSKDEVVQLPVLPAGATSVLVPMPGAFAADATYRLTAIAQTTDGDMGPQSIVVRRAQTEPALVADQWLLPPANVTATRTSASFDIVAGAKVHGVQWSDANGILLEITMFDTKVHSTDVPELVALPATGALTAKAQGIGADLDVKNFSLDTDKELLWGVAAQPIAVP